MTYKTYCLISGVLFSLVSLAHLLRIIYGMPVVIDGYSVSMMISWIGMIVPGVLAVWAFQLTRS